MLDKALTKVFGSHHDRLVKKLQPKVAAINELENCNGSESDYPDGWVALRDYTSTTRSWPYPLGKHKTARLMYHAYALTYAGLRVHNLLPPTEMGGICPRAYDDFVALAEI